jgi:hypothetical protein
MYKTVFHFRVLQYSQLWFTFRHGSELVLHFKVMAVNAVNLLLTMVYREEKHEEVHGVGGIQGSFSTLCLTFTVRS